MSLSSFSSMGYYVGGSLSIAPSAPATGLDNISSANLIHYYNFETAGLSGSTFKNGISGGTADITLSGSNFIDTTIYKNGAGALKITSSNFGYLTTGKNLYSATQTLAFKFYVSSTGISTFNHPFGSYYNGIANYNNLCQVYQNGANYVLRFYFYNPSVYDLTLSNNIALNTWHSVAITKNGTTLQGFLNGAYVTQVATGTDYKLFNNSSTNTFAFGRDRNQTTLTFNGDIDDFRLYNRVLTNAEITTLHSTLT